MKNALAHPIQFRAAVDAALIRTANFDGRSHIVIPIVALVGDSVIRPIGSSGPEFVPSSELSRAPVGWNGRVATYDHPHGGGVSANAPAELEACGIGTVFNTTYADGRLKMEMWIDPARAERVSDGAPAQLVREIADGARMAEVSVGALVYGEPATGTAPNGDAYEYIWRNIVPDHVALLPAGKTGACSVEAGCGAPRTAAQENDIMDIMDSTLVTAVLSKARRPSFSGTESTPWKSPTLADFGIDKNVADLSAAEKRKVAAHSLLGDPSASTLRDLLFFPVVNPKTGKLNEGALRAVLGGRGSQANISSAAKASAQNMARRLLKSEFGADMKTNAGGFVSRLFAALSLRGAAAATSPEPSTDGMSAGDLSEMLYHALRAVEPGFAGVVDLFPDTSTVVYACYPEDEVIYYQRAYTHAEGADEVTLADAKQQVEMKMQYVPVTTPADGESEDDMTAVSTAAAPATAPSTTAVKTASCGTSPANTTAGGVPPVRANTKGEPMKTAELVGRILACETSPFTEAHRKYLEAIPEDELAKIVESLPGEKKEAAPAVPVAPAVAPTTAAAAAVADPNIVQLRRDEYEDMRAAASAFKTDQVRVKTALVTRLVAAQKVYTAEQLNAKPIEDLDALVRLLDLSMPVDYSGRGTPASLAPTTAAAAPAPPDPWRAAVAARRKQLGLSPEDAAAATATAAAN